MKLDVFGCELDIDGKMRGAVSFHDNNTSVSFTADDGSSISIIEDGTIPHDASTSLSTPWSPGNVQEASTFTTLSPPRSGRGRSFEKRICSTARGTRSCSPVRSLLIGNELLRTVGNSEIGWGERVVMEVG
jgi:hypothetical protein